jgi:hypothetical protein
MDLEPTAKVLFRVESNDDDAYVETLWAIPLGQDRYKLDNSPFYAYGVSWQDTVLAPIDPKEQMPIFQSVLVRSGNRTVRLVFDAPVVTGSESDQTLQGLIALGCSYEGAKSKRSSVNIPAAVKLEDVRSYLIEREVEWEHADPTYEVLFPHQA